MLPAHRMRVLTALAAQRFVRPLEQASLPLISLCLHSASPMGGPRDEASGIVDKLSSLVAEHREGPMGIAQLHERMRELTDEASAAAARAAAAAAPPPLPDAPPPTSLDLRLADAVTQYAGRGPQTGIFCDGSCAPNPGPGGWGTVAVEGGHVRWHLCGSGPGMTTNNQMEYTAIIQALRKLPSGATATIYSDSELCVNSITQWARKWEANGWSRAGGKKVENLELVREAYALFNAQPNVELQWIRGHAGWQWNEAANFLANAGRSGEL